MGLNKFRSGKLEHGCRDGDLILVITKQQDTRVYWNRSMINSRNYQKIKADKDISRTFKSDYERSGCMCTLLPLPLRIVLMISKRRVNLNSYINIQCARLSSQPLRTKTPPSPINAPHTSPSSSKSKKNSNSYPDRPSSWLSPFVINY